MKNIFLFLLLITGVSLRAQKNDPSTLTKVGQSAPGFSFQLTRDSICKLEDYKGKIVMINFFATWCPPCRAELPRVESDIWKIYKNNPRFALLVFAREEGWDKVTPFKQQNGFTFPVLPDEGRKIFSLYATQSIPRNVIIDTDGKIIYQSIGYDPKEFSQMLKLLEEKLKEE